MAGYRFDCQRCTNMAVNAGGWKYCRPMVEGRRPLTFHDEGCNELDYFTCAEYTEEPKTAAMYEILRNMSRNEQVSSRIL